MKESKVKEVSITPPDERKTSEVKCDFCNDGSLLTITIMMKENDDDDLMCE